MDEDIRTMVRSLREFTASEFDALNARLSSIESAWANSFRDGARHHDRMEERLQSLEARISVLETEYG